MGQNDPARLPRAPPTAGPGFESRARLAAAAGAAATAVKTGHEDARGEQSSAAREQPTDRAARGKFFAPTPKTHARSRVRRWCGRAGARSPRARGDENLPALGTAPKGTRDVASPGSSPGRTHGGHRGDETGRARYNPPPSARPPALLHGALAQARAASRRAAPRGQSPGLF